MNISLMEDSCFSCGAAPWPVGLVVCGKCEGVSYCSQECQSRDLINHQSCCIRIMDKLDVYRENEHRVDHVYPIIVGYSFLLQLDKPHRQAVMQLLHWHTREHGQGYRGRWWSLGVVTNIWTVLGKF